MSVHTPKWLLIMIFSLVDDDPSHSARVVKMWLNWHWWHSDTHKTTQDCWQTVK